MLLNEVHTRAERQPVKRTSPDIAAEQLAKLRHLFPEVFTEGKVDFEKLWATLGESVAPGPECFSFTSAGKSEAVALLQTPSHATLIPCPEESVNFETTANAFIEGDNLEVLKLLFKPYFGRVKLNYIDPPYNTGQDLVYPDDYADPLATYLRLTGQMDAAGNLLPSNPATSGRYHSAWLSMMYPRLFLARQLLREDGVICVSIDDHEVHHLRLLMNEVFEEENFIPTCVWQKSYSRENRGIIGDVHDYLVFYAREREGGPTLPVDECDAPTCTSPFTLEGDTIDAPFSFIMTDDGEAVPLPIDDEPAPPLPAIRGRRRFPTARPPRAGQPARRSPSPTRPHPRRSQARPHALASQISSRSSVVYLLTRGP